MGGIQSSDQRRFDGFQPQKSGWNVDVLEDIERKISLIIELEVFYWN
jgi:hypothetical protein